MTCKHGTECKSPERSRAGTVPEGAQGAEIDQRPDGPGSERVAKGQDLTRYQKGIVNRYYDHLDTISLEKLSEAVSELYVCSDDKKAEKLWKSVELAIKKLPADPKAVAQAVGGRDLKALAALVNKLSGGR